MFALGHCVLEICSMWLDFTVVQLNDYTLSLRRDFQLSNNIKLIRDCDKFYIWNECISITR